MVFVVVALGVLVIAGVLVVRGLASGSGAAGRASVDELRTTEIADYFDRTAKFAATGSITVPNAADKDLYGIFVSGDYLSWMPLVEGPKLERAPQAAGDWRTTYLFVVTLRERAVLTVPGRELVFSGTGLSIPMIVASFAERYTFTPTADGGVTIDWTVAGTPKWIGFLPLRWAAFLFAPLLKFVLRGVIKHNCTNAIR